MITQERAKTYFTEKKPGIIGAILMFLATALMLYSLTNGWNIWKLVAACVFILVGIGLIKMRNRYPSDAEIDASFIELKDIKAGLSLDKLGISKEDIVREPLKVLGVYNYQYEKVGDDGLMRYNPVQVEIMHFGKNQLFVNTADVDLINQDAYVGKTNEFFYKDISAVSIQDSDNTKRFVIKVSGETELDVAIYCNDQDSLRSAEEAVNVIRKILREIKSV
ncbi:MAG: hypothetical protein J1E31_08305 [Helicobacter sp.]|nr:hypothetical protein [Helicobacter sp.]